MPHLLVALSAHGYGHGAQTAAVVNALRERIPHLQVTLCTTLPQEFLRRRFTGAFETITEDPDVGMCMASAIEIRREDSARAYARFHADWEARVARAAERLHAAAPDLVLSNVAYLPLAGAARAGIAAVGMCSLNWADVYHYYFRGRAEAARIERDMRAAYAGAQLFLRLAPGMPMPDLTNAVTIGPVAALGRDRRAEIRARLRLARATRLVMIAPGGIELRLPIERWRMPGAIHWLVPKPWGVERVGVSALEDLGMAFTDVLRACDAIVGKPGYGTFAEVACDAVPMLYVARGDWPEEPYLTDWLARHGRASAIERARLERGDVIEALDGLWSQPVAAAVAPTGIAAATDRLAGMLPGTRRSASSVPAGRQ
jgi:hypothetical protein